MRHGGQGRGLRDEMPPHTCSVCGVTNISVSLFFFAPFRLTSVRRLSDQRSIFSGSCLVTKVL